MDNTTNTINPNDYKGSIKRVLLALSEHGWTFDPAFNAAPGISCTVGATNAYQQPDEESNVAKRIYAYFDKDGKYLQATVECTHGGWYYQNPNLSTLLDAIASPTDHAERYAREQEQARREAVRAANAEAAKVEYFANLRPSSHRDAIVRGANNEVIAPDYSTVTDPDKISDMAFKHAVDLRYRELCQRVLAHEAEVRDFNEDDTVASVYDIPMLCAYIVAHEVSDQSHYFNKDRLIVTANAGNRLMNRGW